MTSGLPWGLALSSGVNTYLPLFLLALFARFGHIVHVSPRFAWLVSDQAIVVLGLLAAVEILAQKLPALDNFWDFAHTLLRPIAGALAAGATVTADNAFEIVLAMLMGGLLAAAAHSTKSSIRLMSTSKSFGAANLVLSLGEDAAVLAGTLLSVYAPWVMLGVVVTFLVVFALIGPRLLRTLVFDLHILGGGLCWLWRWMFGLPLPRSLKESLFELRSARVEKLAGYLEPGEELVGALTGWRRSAGGPKRTWLLLTSRRLIWIERRLLHKPRIRVMAYGDVSVARYRNLVLFSKVEVLTRQNESVTLSVSKTHAVFGRKAVQNICRLAGLDAAQDHAATRTATNLAQAVH